MQLTNSLKLKSVGLRDLGFLARVELSKRGSNFLCAGSWGGLGELAQAFPSNGPLGPFFPSIFLIVTQWSRFHPAFLPMNKVVWGDFKY